MSSRSSFGSKFGMLAAAVGSAVGLGNIWKFPYIAGSNGGGAFLMVYLICVLLMGFPALITELTIGRMSASNPASAFGKIAGKSKWNVIGILFVLSAFMISAFYYVVAGWSLEYIYETFATGCFSDMDAAKLKDLFEGFAFSSYRPYLWLTIFLIATVFIVQKGVNSGVEKMSSILMPLLFVIILFLAIYSAFLPNNAGGYEFYLSVDFSKITPSVVLSALGQSFFSLSIATGAILIYGSYMTKGNIVTTSLQISLLDTLIAFLAGLMIFPAVFAFGIEPGEGPSLAFNALPAVFGQMPGGVIFSTLFFLLLTIGALTSTISLQEVLTATVAEQTGWSRNKANIIMAIAVFIGAILCCYSLADNSLLYFGDRSLFTWFNDITSDYLLPIGGIFMALFLGWVVPKKRLRETLAEYGMKHWFFNIYLIFVRIIIPLIILLVILQKFNVLNFLA